MPVLKYQNNVQQLYLPSTKEAPEADRAWVKMDVSPIKAADLSAITDVTNKGTMGIEMLSYRISEWNYTNESGEMVPVNEDTVGLLSIEDFTYLQDKIQAGDSLTDSEKKALSNTPSPAGTAQVIPVQSL